MEKSMRILIADQDREHRQQLIAIIQNAGHKPEEALTGREVLEICRKKCPDLILVDFQLAGESGVEIVRQIRQTGGHAAWVPIMIMGKQFSDTDILLCAEGGADDVLIKPVSKVRLMVKIYSALRHLNLKEEVFKVAHELVVANRALQSVVTQDVLTGIGNSNSFEEMLEQEWFKAKQNNKPISMILLNLDFFQNFNQKYGAEKGDEAIRKVADALKFALPSSGNTYVARMTGETFGVLLPSFTGKEAFKVAEELRTVIENLNIPHETSGCSNHVTASFGVAYEDKEYTKPWDLKDAADYALYQAKHYGRNRSYLIQPTPVV